ncbi:uncharacterized protein [Porites lutea]|uniref:uncharacterized protein n=1 Tax=Porites lutea TaxID=51062 RepID=UPI003CC568AA
MLTLSFFKWNGKSPSSPVMGFFLVLMARPRKYGFQDYSAIEEKYHTNYKHIQLKTSYLCTTETTDPVQGIEQLYNEDGIIKSNRYPLQQLLMPWFFLSAGGNKKKSRQLHGMVLYTT